MLRRLVELPRPAAVAGALVLAALLLWFVILPAPYLISIMTLAAIWYLLLASLNIVQGHTGLFSLGQAALYGLGAYVTAICVTRLGVNPVVALALAMVSAALLALLVAIPFSRLRGHFLAMATLAFQAIFTQVATQWAAVTGGANGILAKGLLTIGGLQVSGPLLLILVLLTDVLFFLLLRNLTLRKTGRALAAIKADELMAESFGINSAAYKVLAFTVSGAVCGVAGFWYFWFAGFVDPGSFDLSNSIYFLTALIIGGQGTVLGPIIGDAVYYAIQLTLSNFPTRQGLLFGIALIVVVSFTPIGIAGLLSRLWHRLIRPEEDHVIQIEAARGAVRLATAEELEPERESAPRVAPLVVDSVDKAYGGVVVLRGVSFQITGSGQVFSVIGPNGAGKTTLLNLITGVDRNYGGTIRIFGQDSSRLPSRKVAALGVARTFQVPRLVLEATALENVLIGMHTALRKSLAGELAGSPGVRREDREAVERARELLGSVGLSSAAHRPVAILAHGPRRVLEVARALAARPRVLILDEPAAGLNESEVEWLGRILRAVADAHRLTVVLVDHNMDLIMNLSDEVAVLDGGVLIARGRPDAVRGDRQVQDAYLGKVSRA